MGRVCVCSNGRGRSDHLLDESPNMTPNSRRDLLWTYDRLDDILPVDFTLTTKPNAEIRNYAWGEEYTPSGNWAGYARTNWNSVTESTYWMIHVKEFTSNFSRVLALHEVGHALGLEHPFDDQRRRRLEQYDV